MRPYFEASKARSMSSIPVAPTRIRPRRRRAASSRPPAAGNTGRPDRPRLTRATRPGCRMLPARQRRFGPSSSGGRSPSSVRFGSRPDATIGAAISSPEARTTPVTRPSSVATPTTSAPVRISAPKARAAAASASASAPGPPFAKTVWPAAPPSLPAESASSAAVVPIDQAPSAVNATARIATAARTGSLSNDSATKSAIAIGRTRSSWRASSFESFLNARPSSSPVIASPRPAPLVAGGVASLSEAMNAASARTCRSNPAQAAPSAADQARSSSAVRAGSAHRVTARPSGWGREGPDLGRDQGQPVAAEAELAGNGRPQPAHRVEEAGRALPVGQQTRLHRAAERGALLEHERPEAGLREVGTGDEAVVAAADHDRLVRGGGLAGHRSGHLRPARLEQLERGEPPVRAHDPAARMRR